jgi:hypothetical protein
LYETQETEAGEATRQELPAPQGIGMAVAFDWGLAVQILLTPFIATFLNRSSLMNIPGLNPLLGDGLLFVVALLGAFALIVFGEMIRSGRKWALRIQIVANALLSIIGIFSLVNFSRNASVGNFWPLIVWRLSRPATALWFQLVSATDARKRHGGTWVWFIALWAIVGGVLQTIAAMK